jgi:CPA1 family monovalent cation:H+ antiporter
MARVQDAASFTVLSFVGAFGVWLLAERIGLSAIVTIVVFGMTLAQASAATTTARNRISSYSVWETIVFVLNVLAFLIMGLQARQIIDRFSGSDLFHAIGFGCGVLAAVVLVRFAYVYAYVGVVKLKNRLFGAALAPNLTAPTLRGAAIVSWCGMRGLVTLATAFALPRDFPGRDLIVLAAFIVVLGTLILQGLTLRPLIRMLNFPGDDSVEREVSRGRTAIMQAALDALEHEPSPAAAIVRKAYAAARAVAEDAARPQASTELDQLRLAAIDAQRRELDQLRKSGEISDEAYRRLQEEIDWAELDAAPAGHFQPLATDDPTGRR